MITILKQFAVALLTSALIVGIVVYVSGKNLQLGIISGIVLSLIWEYLRGRIMARIGSMGNLIGKIKASFGKDLYIAPGDNCGGEFLELAKTLNLYGRSMRSLFGKATNQSNQVVLVSKSIAESAKYVKDQASLAVDRANNMASAMEEMKATVQEIARNSSMTYEESNSISAAAKTGMDNLQGVSSDIQNVALAFNQAQSVFTDLKKSSDEIQKVIDTINDLTTQTKLLAFNASLEAARAGEHGRGFAVVAKEVQSLAESTAKSTEEIAKSVKTNHDHTVQLAETIEKMNGLINNVMSASEQTNATLSTVTEGIGNVHTMLRNVAAATDEQKNAVGLVATNIEQLAKASQETLKQAESSLKASFGIEKLSKDLELRLNEFSLTYFGLVPAEDAIKMNNSFGPLAEYLSQVVGDELIIRLGHDYDDAIKDIGTNRAMISYQTPSTYIEAREKYGVEPLVVSLPNGETTYRSAIVVHSDSGINSIEELRDHTFAFGDPKSTGNKAMPEAMLRAAGVSLSSLKSYGFVGSHDNVAKAVQQKAYSGGGLMLSVAEKYTNQGVKIIGTSDPIPQFPICASPDLSPSLREKINEALISLKDEEILKAIGPNVTGFAKITDSDYNGVRKMLNDLK